MDLSTRIRRLFFPPPALRDHEHGPGQIRCGLVVTSLDTGGVEEVVALLATHLATHDITTSILCTHRGGKVADRLHALGIPVTVGEGAPRQWKRWIEEEAPDICSTHYLALEMAEVLAAKGIPFVETVHNTYLWHSPDEWEKEGKKAAYARGLIGVSPLVAEYYGRVCSGDRPISIVPNGVDGSRIVRFPRTEARQLLGIEEDDVVLLQVGRFCLQKNQAGLVAALAGLLLEESRLKLLLLGNQGDSEYVQQVSEVAGPLLANGSVRFLPVTPEVGIALSAADAFLANSFFEGWSLAASESLWVGVPVILSESGGARELIGENERGIMVPNPGGDPRSLIWADVISPKVEFLQQNGQVLQSAVSDLVTNRASWESRSDELRAYAQTHLSAEGMAEKYAAILRCMLEKKQAPGP